MSEGWLRQSLKLLNKKLVLLLASKLNLSEENLLATLEGSPEKELEETIASILIENEGVNSKKVQEVLGHFHRLSDAERVVGEWFKQRGFKVYKAIEFEKYTIDIYAYKEMTTSFGSLIPTGGSVSESVAVRIAITPETINDALEGLSSLRGCADFLLLAISPYVYFKTLDRDGLVNYLKSNGIGLMAIHYKLRGARIIIEPETQPREPEKYMALRDKALLSKKI